MGQFLNVPGSSTLEHANSNPGPLTRPSRLYVPMFVYETKGKTSCELELKDINYIVLDSTTTVEHETSLEHNIPQIERVEE